MRFNNINFKKWFDLVLEADCYINTLYIRDATISPIIKNKQKINIEIPRKMSIEEHLYSLKKIWTYILINCGVSTCIFKNMCYTILVIIRNASKEILTKGILQQDTHMLKTWIS